MRFQLLGPLSITDGDGQNTVVLQPSKPTVLLAALLLHANTVVSVERLQRTVWGGEQPATAKAALQTCVLRLRRMFSQYGVTDAAIEAVPGGYRVTAGPADLDLLQFRTRVRASADLAAEPEAELAALRQALALWQDSVLANVPSEVLHRDEVPQLTEERLRTVERVCDLELRLGRHGQALTELWGATRAFPAHERLRELLIEALYRSGRQAEALAEYRDIKTYLRDELGMDPSSSLQRLELAILRGDDIAAHSGQFREQAVPGASVPSHRSSSAAEAVPGAEPRRQPAASLLRPARDAVVVPVTEVPGFVGREDDTAAVTAQLSAEDGTPTPVLVSGAPGSGKTALARHVAHLARDRFTGGRFLVRLVRPDGASRTAEDVAAGMAAALDGVRGPTGGPGERAGRVLWLLDDAVDAEQVRRLLPARRGDAVLVTSRCRLAGLVATHKCRVRRLGQLEPEESRLLLAEMLGAPRVDAERAAAHRLAASCGHLPLALCLAAARFSTRPALGLDEAADWLAQDVVPRLAVGDDPRLSVADVLGGALGRLDPLYADGFLRLAAVPDALAGGFDPSDAAPLLGPSVSPAEADAVLDRLADAGLLEDGSPGPYRLHPLLHAYAKHAATCRPKDRSPARTVPNPPPHSPRTPHNTPHTQKV